MIGITSRGFFVFMLGTLLAGSSAWSQTDKPKADEKAAAKKKEQAEEVAFLVEALSNREARIRQNAAKKLSEMTDKPFEALVPVLATAPQFEAAVAALVLNNLKAEADPIPAKTQAALYDILSDPGTEVWRWNITATLLTRIAEPSLKKHIELWMWGVNHPAPMIQLSSLRALQKTKAHGKPAESAVANLLHFTHRGAFTSIQLKPQIITDRNIGWEQAIPAYDPLVILETLAAIQADPGLMVEPLTVLTHAGSEYIRLDAAAMLGQLDAARLHADPRPYAAKVLADLAVLPWGKVRQAAVRELGNIGEPAAIVLPALIGLLEDGNGDVRTEAAVTLGKIGPLAAPALPALKTALEFAKLDTEDAVKAIEKAIARCAGMTNDPLRGNDQ